MTKKQKNRSLTPLGLLLAGLMAWGATIAPTGADAQQRRTAATTQSSDAPVGVVNINTASAQQLAALPGVGESKARAIVSARERRRFSRVEEILRVRGIGRATFRRLRPMLRVDGPTTLGQ